MASQGKTGYTIVQTGDGLFDVIDRSTGRAVVSMTLTELHIHMRPEELVSVSAGFVVVAGECKAA